MRKMNKEIFDHDVIRNLLVTSHTGRLGTVGGDGHPMIKPLNFAFHNGHIYFHCAPIGEKLDDIMRDNRVCFEVDLPIAYVRGGLKNPCAAEYLYRSVIALGRAHIVANHSERLMALDCLMRKYQPDGGYGPYMAEKLALTCIVRIDIEKLTGKEDLGKGDTKVKVLRALEEESPLPIIIAEKGIKEEE